MSTYRGRLIKRQINGAREKLCPCCEQWKPHDDAHYQYLASRGHMQSTCRKCISAQQVARAKAKKEAA